MEPEHNQAGTSVLATAGQKETANYIKGQPTLYLQLKTRIWGINVFESPDLQRNTGDVKLPNAICDVDIHAGGRFPPNMAAFQLDSKIYLVGGGGPNSGAYVYELCPKTSQLLTPTAIPHRLNGPKVNPIAETIAGKVHIIDRDLISPLCYEVLRFSADSKSWTWNSLPPPLQLDEENAAYFFDDSSWVPTPQPSLRPPPSSRSADLPDFQLMGGRTLRNCPGFEATENLHVCVAYQGDFDVIGENKHLGAFLVRGGEDLRVVAYQSLLLPEEESSDSSYSRDFYPEELPYGVVELGDGVICAVVAGYRDDEHDVVRVCVLRVSRKPSWSLEEEEEEFLDVVKVLEQREYGLDELEESVRSPVCSAFLF